MAPQGWGASQSLRVLPCCHSGFGPADDRSAGVGLLSEQHQPPIDFTSANAGHLRQTQLGQNRPQRLHNPIALKQPGGDLSEQLAPPVDRDVISQRQRRPRLGGPLETLAVINERLSACHGLTIQLPS
jgi:hypothetical protein